MSESYKIEIDNSRIPRYKGMITIRDSAGNFVNGYYFTELKDNRKEGGR